MITELNAQNFKSWQNTGKLHFAPLTGFFGANSSGKSSILQILLLLKQTVEQPSEWNEPLNFGNEESLVDLRSFYDVIHQPIKAPSLGISVSWKLPDKVSMMSEHQLDTLSFYFNFHNSSIGSLNYRFGEYQFGIEPAESGEHYLRYSNSTRLHKAIPFRCYGIRLLPEKTPVRSDIEKIFENLFSRIHHLGSLRKCPRRSCDWGDIFPTGIGQDREKMTDMQIMKWLQDLDLIYSYGIYITPYAKKDYEVRVRKYRNGAEVGLTDVGVGVSQVLPVLFLCRYADEGSILILEQPEAHLHPKAQSELADVLIDVVKKRNIQIIFESHSEHLLHRLQRRIAESRISANDTAFYFCQINGGISEIKKLDVDEYGNILNYPQDFFGDDLGDLVAKTEAEMKRREAAE